MSRKEVENDIAEAIARAGIDEQGTSDILESMSTCSRHIALKGDIKRCSDTDDDIFIEAAILRKVRYLITGDKGIMTTRSSYRFCKSMALQ